MTSPLEPRPDSQSNASGPRVKNLIKELFHRKPKVRNVAAIQLASMQAPLAHAALAKAFSRLSRSMRGNVMLMLNVEPSTLPIFIQALRDPNKELSQTAAHMLIRYPTPDGLAALAKSNVQGKPVDDMNWFLMNQNHPDYLPALIHAVANLANDNPVSFTRVGSILRESAAHPTLANHPVVRLFEPWRNILFDPHNHDFPRLNEYGTAKAMQLMLEKGARAFKNRRQLQLFIKQAQTTPAK